MSTNDKPRAAIKAVLLDWGGVMEPIPGPAEIAAWETRLGIAADSLPSILWGDLWQRVEIGAASLEEYGASICAACGFPDQAALDAFYAEFYPRGARPEMVATVRALRPRYHIALITNAWQGQREHIEELIGGPVEDLFEHYVNSAEVGVRKPAPAIFHLALARLGVAPAEAVFIDDVPANVDAAAAIGIHAIHFQDPATVLATLEGLLGHPLTDAM
jgi:epoxide hydrolase-like predicted phosphatase